MSDTKKPSMSLIPMRALVGAARVFDDGNLGREPGDWIKRDVRVFVDALLRHLTPMMGLNGAVTFESLGHLDHSDLPTIDHVICNALMIRACLIRDGVLAEDPVRSWLTDSVADFEAKRKAGLFDPSPDDINKPGYGDISNGVPMTREDVATDEATWPEVKQQLTFPARRPVSQ